MLEYFINTPTSNGGRGMLARNETIFMSARSLLVLFHRWIGLAIAGFLLIAGITGSLLAWNDELEAAISPQLFHAQPPSPEAQPLDPLELRERVQATYPGTFVALVPLTVTPGHAQVFYLFALPDPATGTTPELANNQVFVNPYTGQVQGERKLGDITQGWKNLMPFIYRLHYSLALNTAGRYVFGFIALLWTLDCFIALWLTFPLSARKTATPRSAWLARWWSAWKVRFLGSSYKLNFDLHRAGGLWVWAMLFVLALSSLALNLPEVYQPAMKSIFSHQAGRPADKPLSEPLFHPPVDWYKARSISRNYIKGQANAQGFTVLEEYRLSYDPRTGIYRYRVRSSRDVSEHWGSTSLYIDGRNGDTGDLWFPSGAAAGNTITTWITALHMAALWGLPMKVFVCFMGLVVAMLCITGVIIWSRKRSARLRSVERKKCKTNASSTTHQPGTTLAPQTEFRSSLLKKPSSRETA